MDRLPAEIIYEIISHLKALEKAHYGRWRSNLSPYATINRTWQSVIEHETFSRIKIDADTLPELIPLLSGATGDRRIRSIRALEFNYLLDRMGLRSPTNLSWRREQEQLANGLFSGDMRALFGLLKGWEDRLGGSERVAAEKHQLCLFLARGLDRGVPTMPHPSRRISISPRPADALPDAPVVDPWQEYELELRYGPRPDVQYIGDEKLLPELSLVSSVTVCEGHGIHPESLMRVLSRMKCLDCLDGYVFDEMENPDLTCEYRKALAQSLQLLPRSLSVFNLDFLSDFSEPLTSDSLLVDPQRDHLCISIRILSGQLRKLKLSGLRISSAVFAGNGDGSYPDWSSLEEIKISYPEISSTGQWFANRAPPEVVTQDDSYYSNDPNDYKDCTYVPSAEPLNELFAAAGRAKQHMPRLKYIDLRLSIDFGKHIFLYYFNREKKRNMVASYSTGAFGFSKEVAEAWGFSLPEGETPRDGDMFINEVIVM